MLTAVSSIQPTPFPLAGSHSANPVALHQPVEASQLDRDVNRLSELNQPAEETDETDVRKKFESVLGELLFREMLKSMRKSVGKAAYFNGGRAEEIFTEQLDQVLSEKMSQASASQFVGPMYDLFMLERS
ncbi:MAG: rod-binding protein [Pirellulales bacterium]|nr:rod-binding protein [Pirellulales bacterium]